MPSNSDIVVLKFGSSILPTESSLPLAVHEVYHYLRQGKRVVAVVSAIGSTTDALLAKAAEFGPRLDPVGVASLVATGEATSVALLTLALDRAGIPANALDAGAIALKTTGPVLDANPESLDTEVILKALADRSVLVVPGFLGRDEIGRTTLLGRGGSDFSALYIAAALGAPCILLKDVDALYDRDPAEDPRGARKLVTASYEDVLGLSEGIVQHKAVRFARDRGVPVSIAAIGRPTGTTICAGRTTLGGSVHDGELPPLRVALLGLGTVGLGVYEHVRCLPRLFQVTGIGVRDVTKHRSAGVPASLLSDDPESVAADADVVIEVMGGIEPARTIVRNSLARGVHVVTANKGLLARHGRELRDASLAGGSLLLHSASVGGGVPVLEQLASVAACPGISRLDAVINGTTNFILDRLAEGTDFDAAVSLAQRSGFAEADPSDDLDGVDAACKLVVIAQGAFGVELRVDDVERRGIRGLKTADARRAQERGCAIRLVGSIVRDGVGVRASVAPREVPLGSPFAQTRDEHNCVVAVDNNGKELILRGRGAGRFPTAQSVLGDLLQIAHARADAACQPVEAVA